MNCTQKVLVATLILLVSAALQSFAVTIDGITYTVATSNSYPYETSAYVTSASDNLRTANILEEITVDGYTYTVTTISERAFYGLKSLETVTIPSGVTLIEKEAFYNCPSLQTVYFNAKACTQCGEMYDESRNSNARYMGNPTPHSAFPGNLKNVVMGDGVTRIPRYFLYDCSEVTSIELQEGIKTICSYAFSGTGLTEVTIPESLTNLEWDAFTRSSLKKVYYNAVNSSTTYNSSGFFSDTLEEIIFGGKVTAIPPYLFSGCNNLTSVTIPEYISLIGDCAFAYCNNLKTIYYNARNCEVYSKYNNSIDYYFPKELTDFIVGENVETLPIKLISSCTIDNLTINSDHEVIYGSFGRDIKHLTIGDKMTTIPNNAFSGCKLVSMTLPASLTSIGAGAFSDCKSLESLTLPNTVTSIGADAFSGCSALNSLTIPESVAEMGKGCFYGCTGVETLWFNAIACADFEFVHNNDFLRNVKDVIFGDKVKKIPNFIFCSYSPCYVLDTVSIGESVAEIGRLSFGGVSALTKLIFNPADYRAEGLYGVFPSNLKEAVFSDKVTRIPASILATATGLISVSLPNSLQTIGASAFSDCGGLTSITLPGSLITIEEGAFFNCKGLTNIALPNSLTTIGASALSHCVGLTSIALPSSLTTIGESAFSYCTGLKSLIIPGSITSISVGTFANCSGLETVTIPNSVTSIGDYAFADCTGLKSISFPQSVTSIGEWAFHGCETLETVACPDINAWLQIKFAEYYSNPTYYAKKLLIGGESIRRLTIPEGVERINDYAFVNCEPLLTATFPTTLRSTGIGVFDGCSGLQRLIFPDLNSYFQLNQDSSLISWTNAKIYIAGQLLSDIEHVDWPETLTEIPSYAFYNQTQLKSVNIPSTVVKIGAYAFSGCSGVEDISIPPSVEVLGENAFSGCSGLRKVNLPNLVSMGKRCFSHCSSLKDVVIGSEITDVPTSAFSECFSLVTVTLPGTVETIGKSAFRGSNKLASITIGEKVKIIGEDAFSGCSGLKTVYFNAVNCEDFTHYLYCFPLNVEKVIFGDKVSRIPARVFDYCSGLKSVSFSSSLSAIGADAFRNCTALRDVKINMDINAWAHVQFESLQSNPIYYSRTFSVGDSSDPVKYLVLSNVGDISPYAFYNAQNLETVRVSGNMIGAESFASCHNIKQLCLDVEVISDNAFRDSQDIETIYSLRTMPPSAPDLAFARYEGVTLYVPEGSVSSYENAPSCWWRFLDIFGSDFSQIDEIFGSEDSSGIFNIKSVDYESAGTVAVYDLSGVKVGDSLENLKAGIYIVYRNGKTQKVFVR